jgi:hypothetical protein
MYHAEQVIGFKYFSLALAQVIEGMRGDAMRLAGEKSAEPQGIDLFDRPCGIVHAVPYEAAGLKSIVQILSEIFHDGPQDLPFQENLYISFK